MKAINYQIMPFLVAGALAWCCGPKNSADSNVTAEKANEEKFDDRKTEKDAEFVADVVAANYAEIAMASLATQKSNNAEVKEVAQMLERDHNKLLGQLQDFASSKAITIPIEAKEDAKKTLEDLTKEEDVKDFNKAWCKEMVNKHEKTIKNFESQADKTEDPDLKAWIDQTLPELRTHLEKVKACEESIKAAS